MPRQVITFRISDETRGTLRDVSKCYGLPPSSFCREAIETICSADMDRIGAFLGRLQTGMAKQLLLDLGKAQKRQERRRRAVPG